MEIYIKNVYMKMEKRKGKKFHTSKMEIFKTNFNINMEKRKEKKFHSI